MVADTVFLAIAKLLEFLAIAIRLKILDAHCQELDNGACAVALQALDAENVLMSHVSFLQRIALALGLVVAQGELKLVREHQLGIYPFAHP